MKCPHCPVAGPDCLGLRAPRLCELAEADTDYRRVLMEQAGESDPVPTPRSAKPRVPLGTPQRG